jgi:hypothetical protein
MKMMVKLAVLFATLLLLTGVSFAAECYDYCYEATTTDLDDPTHTHTGCIGLKFCDDNTGEMMSPFGTNMSLFFDSMKDQVLGYDLSDPSCVGYFKFHGDDLHILKGIGYCEGERHNIKGSRVDCCSSTCPGFC